MIASIVRRPPPIKILVVNKGLDSSRFSRGLKKRFLYLLLTR